MKHESIRKSSETLVIVPCWWDGNIERYDTGDLLSFPLPTLLIRICSLTGIIHFHRPDLIQDGDHAVPIPLNPSVDYFKSMYEQKKEKRKAAMGRQREERVQDERKE